MPTITEEPITALAFCIDGQCLGYKQQPVPALRRTSEFSFRELGGDLPGVEKSTIDVLFTSDEDRVCPECGKPRLVSEQERVEYPNTSGQDPLAIFKHRGAAAEQMRDLKHDAQVDGLRRDLETAELRTALAEQKAMMERQAAIIEELQSRPRGPGRPRRVDGENE